MEFAAHSQLSSKLSFLARGLFCFAVFILFSTSTLALRFDTTHYDTTPDTRGVALGDLDHDNDLDLVITNSQFGLATLTVMFNDGFGVFSNSVTYDVLNRPRAVEIADFNGDNEPDILSGTSNSSLVSILFNNGDATFAPQQTFVGGGGVV